MSAKIEVALLVGADSKAWLTGLEKIVTRFEVAAAKLGTEVPAQANRHADTDEEDDDAGTVVGVKNGKVTTKSKKAATQEQESFDLGDDEVSAEQDEEPSLEDLIGLCRKNKPLAIKTLSKLSDKHFDLSEAGSRKSIQTLKPAHYAKVAAELGA